jgi:hypothetical protein
MRNGLHSWLYLSASNLNVSEEPLAIRQIVDTSRARNVDMDVTGALLFSGTRFVQFLEGPLESISSLQASIKRDARHRDIISLSVRVLRARQFGKWALAYNGESAFVEKVLDKAMAHHARGSRDGMDSLIKLLKQFSPTD